MIRGFLLAKENIKLIVTGNWRRKPWLRRYEGERVKFSGCLPEVDYYRLLACSRGIIAATRREYTALMAAWEAVALAKPLAVTSTRTLREIFGNYAILFSNREESIAEAVSRLLEIRVNFEARERLRRLVEDSAENLKRMLAP